MVLTEVHPFGGHVARSIGVGREGCADEIAHEVLRGRASEGSSGIDVADEHPFGLAVLADGQFEEVGTFPDTFLLAETFPEGAFEGPGLEVGRREDLHFAVERVSQQENPFAGGCVPEHVGVASFGVLRQNGIAFIDGEVLAVVGREGKRLLLGCVG